MSETSSANPPASETVQAPARQTAAPAQVLMAMADPVRYAVMRELSDGSYPAVKDLAAKLHCHPDQMGRHLQRMCQAGIVMEVRAAGRTRDRATTWCRRNSAARCPMEPGCSTLGRWCSALMQGDAGWPVFGWGRASSPQHFPNVKKIFQPRFDPTRKLFTTPARIREHGPL